MPRNMSFSLTTPQFRERSKTVTRRCGWWFLKPGDVVCGVEKGRGLRKGEKIERLGLIRIVSARPQRLSAIKAADVAREGFPDRTPAQFIAMYCKHNRVEPSHIVNRIEFEYLD